MQRAYLTIFRSLIFIALSFSVVLSQLEAADLGVPVTLAEFVAENQGEFTIHKADGNDTKYPDASLIDEGAEVVLTFPFCPENGTLCDPGYIFLPKSPSEAVSIHKKELNGVESFVRYTIVHTEGSIVSTYEWEVPKDPTQKLRFRRFDYVYGTNPPITLEFLFSRKTQP